MESVSSLKKERELTPEAFTKLLANLDPDPEVAGGEYEELRRRLIKFFEWRGAFFPEDLADETLNRTARKIDEGEEIEKNVIALALGVAHFVFLETSRRPDNRRAEMEELITIAAPPEHRVEDDDLRAVYLRECMRGLSKDSRELIIEYYREEGRAKIDDRKGFGGKVGHFAQRVVQPRQANTRQARTVCYAASQKKTGRRFNSEADGAEGARPWR